MPLALLGGYFTNFQKRGPLSIVTSYYPYHFLHKVFGCSSKTVKVHCTLFGRGGTPPSKFTFSRQCILMFWCAERSQSFLKGIMCRGHHHVGEWLLTTRKCPNGTPANFPYNTMFAGLCNICDDFGHSTLRKPGRGHGSGSTDFFHLSPVFYFHSDRMKGNVLIYHQLLVSEIRPPPLKTCRQGPEILGIQTRSIENA